MFSSVLQDEMAMTAVVIGPSFDDPHAFGEYLCCLYMRLHCDVGLVSVKYPSVSVARGPDTVV